MRVWHTGRNIWLPLIHQAECTGAMVQKVADFEELKQNNHEVMTAGRFLFDKIPYKIYHTGTV